MSKVSIDSVIHNWFATLFAYQPDVFYQLDSFRRSLSSDFVSPEQFQKKLLQTGLLTIQTDSNDPRKMYILLDEYIFKAAKGKRWTINVNNKGDELEVSCSEDDPHEEQPKIETVSTLH